ncbi:hypothetical protein [Clostridium sp. C2-6-12]|uniref:hypothetical protein n=1 Tax=Clostridium sp. C2-6-12 TaxID=2698832 RepID=UPI00136E1B72|nr:hypothetical protein [Clostridium sp. C2-6-12]
MSKKYKEDLDKIVMNDEMKKRILNNVLKNNIEAKSITTVVKKNNNFKRNMQLVAACFTVVVCLSVIKNYPEFFKLENNNLKQNQEIEKSADIDNDLKKVKESEVYGNNEDNTSNNDSIKNNEPINSTAGNEEISKKNDSLENQKEDNNKKSVGDVQKAQGINNSNANSEIVTKISPEMQNNNEKAGRMSSEAVNNKKDIPTKENDAAENQGKTTNKENDEIESSSIVSSGYFIKEYKTLEEAEKALNLKINTVKALPKGYNIRSINVIANEIIQIDYNSGEKDISFRAGKEVENISGDYNEYINKNSSKVNDVNVILNGNKDKIINLATWESKGISYSISSRSGIEEETILNMIKSSL